MNKKIVDMIKHYGEENDFYGRINEDDIKLVEKSLNIVFPESYKWFIRNYGSGGICGVEVLGEFIRCIYTNDENKIIRWDRVGKNKEYRYDNFYEYLIDTFQEAIGNWD